MVPKRSPWVGSLWAQLARATQRPIHYFVLLDPVPCCEMGGSSVWSALVRQADSEEWIPEEMSFPVQGISYMRID